MLASDLNNPEFVNPQNPDQFLSVEFYWAEPIDKNKTDKASSEAGKYVPIKMPREVYVRIQKPGDLLSVIETRVREDHKRRWPDRWKYFQIQEGLVNEDIPGWKLDEWDELQKDEKDRLKYLRFFTVEQIAAASDAQCQGIGMGADGLRVRARQALQNRSRVIVREEIAKKDAELDALRKADAEKEERLQKLEALLLNQKPVESPPPADNEHVAPGAEQFVEAPKRRGRPKKVVAA